MGVQRGSEELDDSLDLLLNGQQYKKFQEMHYNAILQEYELNIVDIRVLLFLYEHDCQDTAKDIVAMWYLTKSYVSKSVDKLIEKGYLSRKYTKEDRRYVHLIVKDEAVPIIQRIYRQQKKMFDVLFRGVSEEQLAILREVAGKVRENISVALREGI